ncbi:MAG: hypothetical protein WB608_21685 [Terracidiphilus sp.]
MKLPMQKNQWPYLIMVGFLCAPALLLKGSLRGLQHPGTMQYAPELISWEEFDI